MTPQEKAWKAWGRIIAKAWSNSQFKEYLINHPKQVLAAEGIDIPSAITVEVVEESEAELQHQWQPFNLTIPCGVPLIIPADFEVQIERREPVDSPSELIGRQKLVVSLEIPGIKIQVEQNTDKRIDSLILTLRLPRQQRISEISQGALEGMNLGLEELISDSGQGGCKPLLNIPR